MRGMEISTAILYYITSMLPAWIFLILEISNKNSQVYVIIYNIPLNFLLFLVILLTIVMIIATKILIYKLKHSLFSITSFNPNKITTVNDSFVTFIITFTAPNLIVSHNDNDIKMYIIIQLIFHIIIFMLYFNSSTILPNIMLLFVNYQMYNFENKYWVLTKEKHLRNYYQDIEVKRIGDYLYFHGGNQQ